MLKSIKAVLLVVFFPSLALATLLPAGTEMFILKTEISTVTTLYVRTLNLGDENNFGLVTYDDHAPQGKLFGINPVDKLSYPVATLQDAFYLVLTKTTEMEVTNEWTKGAQGEEFLQRMNINLYRNLSNYLPISNSKVVDVALDLYDSCPAVPSRKNGRACHSAKAKQLPSYLKREIRRAAVKYGQEPALVASIIQHESGFNPYIENLHEKKKCIDHPEKCSPYKWGKGLAQLGATDAHFFGLNWFKEIAKPKQCDSSGLLNKQCFSALRAKCKRFSKDQLKPVNCPLASIEAVARKLQSLIPEQLPAWVKKEDGTSKLINLSSALQRTQVEKIRNLIGLYNRGVKVYNSFVEFYDHNRRFPEFFGEAWAMPRTEKSPSISMGYQMLTKEYIGRCYVWELAGICGDDMPKRALVRQFMKQF